MSAGLTMQIMYRLSEAERREIDQTVYSNHYAIFLVRNSLFNLPIPVIPISSINYSMEIPFTVAQAPKFEDSKNEIIDLVRANEPELIVFSDTEILRFLNIIMQYKSIKSVYELTSNDLQAMTQVVLSIRSGDLLPSVNGLPVTPVRSGRPMSMYGQLNVNRGQFLLPSSPQHVPGTNIGRYNTDGTLRTTEPVKKSPPGCPGQAGRAVSALGAKRSLESGGSRRMLEKEVLSEYDNFIKKWRRKVIVHKFQKKDF